MIITAIGYLAAFLTTVSFLPQAIKTVRTRDTSSISLGMYVFFTLGVIFWMVYGLYTGQPSIYIANAVTAVFALIILGFKIDGMRRGK